jgi:hypothetical protein
MSVRIVAVGVALLFVPDVVLPTSLPARPLWHSGADSCSAAAFIYAEQ